MPTAKATCSRNGGRLRIVATGVCALVLCNAGHAIAQTVWSALGSTGIVDEADTSEVRFDGTGVEFRPTTPAQARAVIRYPVTGLSNSAQRVHLEMLYHRPDEWAYASATLKRFSLYDGTTSIVASVNSWDSPPAPGNQMVQKTIICSTSCYVGGWNVHYIEVTLWKPQATSSPRVVALRVWTEVY